MCLGSAAVFFAGSPGLASKLILGVFEMTGIAPRRRGQSQIEVSLDVDSAAITVSAMDLLTGADLPVTVSGQGTPGPIPS